jgi:F-type H+-transporting ATPase subunit beta
VTAAAQGAESGANAGRVIAVRGSVVDVRFPPGALPAINEAVTIVWDIGRPIIAEVQQHLDAATVRVVALESTAGLNRGTAARATGVDRQFKPGLGMNGPVCGISCKTLAA